VSNSVSNLIASMQFTTAVKIWTYDSSELLALVRKVCVEDGLVDEFDAFQRAHSQVTNDVVELMGIRQPAEIPSAEEKLVNDALAFSTTLDALFEKARRKATEMSILRFREKKKAWAISALLERAFADLKPNLMEILKSRGLDARGA
jgi:hypothetical protein